MPPLKVFAFDHGSAAGPVGVRPAAAQRQDGALMLRALRADLGLLPDVHLLAFDDGGARAAGMTFERQFRAGLLAADAVWPLAPLAGGVLERLSRDVLRHRRILLGTAPDTVRVAASKRATCAALQRGGVPTVATYGPGERLPVGAGGWVVKPDDGAGCVDTRLFHDSAAAQEAAAGKLSAMERPTRARRELVLQPFVAGRVGSLSLLCHDGAAEILACNELRMAVHGNRFRFLGVTVNGLAAMAPALVPLARGVAAALPGLWGYAGVDFILAADGALVLDVNPRLTMSYAGLRASTGGNPAAAVLALLEGAVPSLQGAALPASVDVAASGPGLWVG